MLLILIMSLRIQTCLLKPYLDLFYHWYGSWYSIWSKLSVSYQNVSWSSGQRGLNNWNTPFKLFSFTCWMRRSQYSARWGSQVFNNRQSACLPFALRKSIIIIALDSEHACSLLQRETLFLSSKAIHCGIIFEKIVQNKVSASAHKMCRNSEIHGKWKIVSQPSI